MYNKNPRTLFLEFVQMNSDLVALKDHYNALIKQINEDVALQTSMMHDDHDKRVAVYQAGHNVHELESLLKQVAATIAHLNRSLDQSTHHKEYEDLHKKIQHATMQQEQLENELVQAWAKRDEMNRAFQHHEVWYQEQVVKLNQQIADEKMMMSDLESQIMRKQQAMQEMRLSVSPRLLGWFERMHDQIAQPVVLAVGGVCQGCFNGIPDKDMMRLKKGAFIMCKACYRCLYVKDYEPSVFFVDEIQS